jgi:capsular exopolysaccharide synthesis family protein
MAGDVTLYDPGGEGPLNPRPPRARIQPYSSTSPPPDVDPTELASILRRRRGAIVFGLFVVLGTVALLTFVWPRTYASTALIVVEPQESNNGVAFLERLVQGSQIETETELMRSRNVVERVVDQLDLHVAVHNTPSAGGNVWNKAVAWGRSKIPSLQQHVRPDEVFPVFSAGSDATPGVFRFENTATGGYLVRDVEGDSIVGGVAVADQGGDQGARGNATWFAGYMIAPPSVIPENGVTMSTSQFARAVDATRGNIIATRVHRDADLIELKCVGASASLAHDLCEKVLENYVQLRTNLQRVEATTTAEFLRGQVATLGQRLREAEDRLQGYTSREQIVALDERASAEVRQYTSLRAQRDQLDAERAALGEMIQSVATGDGTTRAYRDIASFPSFMSNPAITELFSSLFALETQRSELATRRSDQNTEVVALDDRVTEIERQLLTIATSYQDALMAQVRSQDAKLQDLGQRLSVIPGQQVTSARLDREVTQLRDLHSMLLTRLREAEVAEAVNLPSVRVVDHASVPLDPATPNVKMNLVLGVVLGLAYGLALAFYREFRDKTVHGRNEVEKHTGIPVLTMLPQIKKGESVLPVPEMRLRLADGAEVHDWKVEQKSALSAASTRSRFGGKKNGASNGRSAESFQFTDDKQIALESFRSLATDVRLAARFTRGGGRVVAVTSPGRGEGKTFTACNLALVQAAQATRCLVIDADMRAQGVGKFFNCSSTKPGLSDLIAGDGELHGVWKADVNGAGSELWVLPCGTADLYSGGLFGSQKFHLLLQRVRLQFDLIVIDTPPINLISDATSVATVADAVIVIVREGFTDNGALAMAMDRLHRCGANVVGTVMNDAEMPEYYGHDRAYATSWQVVTDNGHTPTSQKEG